MHRISLVITAVLLISLSIICYAVQVNGQAECSTLGGLIGSLAFSPDGKYLLLGKGNIAELWSIRDQSYLRSFIGHGQQLGPFSLAVAFAPDGNHIVTGGSDATLRVWNTATGVQEFQVAFHKGEEITKIAYLRSGAGIIASTLAGAMYLWTGQPMVD